MIEKTCCRLDFRPSPEAQAPDVGLDAAIVHFCNHVAVEQLSEVRGMRRWLDARTAQLHHPQLPTPLDYIEITCGVSVRTGGLEAPQRDPIVQSVLQQIADALMAHEGGAVIGNAEVVHSVRCPMPLLPSALPTVAVPSGAGDGLDAACATFQQYGLLAMRDAVPPPDVEPLRSAVLEQFDRTLTALRQREGAGDGHHFAEIMRRDQNRFDCQLSAGFGLDSDGADRPAWESLACAGPWLPLVRKLLADDCTVYRCGVVVSLPGAGEQYCAAQSLDRS